MIKKSITLIFPLNSEKVVALERLLSEICRTAAIDGDKGVADGYCPLDEDALIPLANIPATLTGKDADTLDGVHASALPGALVWDHTVTGSAVTSVTTNGEVTLAGLTHGGYDFEFFVANVSGSTISISLYVNNDTTGTNYNRTEHRADGTAHNVASSAAAFIQGIGTPASGNILISGTLSISPSGYFFANAVSFASNNYIAQTGVRKLATIADLTRIDIVSDIASSIGINSRFRLWRKK